jgi:hypothetical protein
MSNASVNFNVPGDTITQRLRKTSELEVNLEEVHAIGKIVAA